MNDRRTVRLGDVVEVTKGLSYQGKFLTDEGLPLVNLKCIARGGGFRADGLKPYSGPYKDRHVVAPGDVVLANTDLTQDGGIIGCPAIVPTLDHDSGVGLISHHLCRVRVRDESSVDPSYLYYALRSPSFRARAQAVASGTTVLGFRTDDIEAFELELPPLLVQRKTARVLGSFDDLIENNRRRIAILEEMARLIFREWFVHFRFPGHEDIALVDSDLVGPIPEGWECETLADAAHLVMGQSPKSEFYNEDGIGLPFHQGVTNFGGRYPEHRKWCTQEYRVAEQGDVLLSVRAPVGRINVAPDRLVVGRGLAALRSTRDTQVFLFETLREVFAEEDSMGGGTIFKAVTKKDLERIALVRPPAAVVGSFENAVGPMFDLVRNLTRQDRVLNEARNLLLPRLISGELDVSDLDLDLDPVV